jgi:hypothetical protein
VEDRYSQTWVYDRKLDRIVQKTMIVLLVLALLALVFAPEEHGGVSAQRRHPSTSAGQHREVAPGHAAR